MSDEPRQPLHEAVRRVCSQDGRGRPCFYPHCRCMLGPAMLAHIIVAVAADPGAMAAARRVAAAT